MDNIVTDSYNQLDEDAGISENMYPLLEFTNQTEELKSNLTEIKIEAGYLDANNTDLGNSLDPIKIAIRNNIIAASCTSDECELMKERADNLTVNNYALIAPGLEPLIDGLDEPEVTAVFELLSTGFQEFKDIVSNINNSVSQDIEKARDASDEVAVKIEDELDNVTEDLTDVGFADLAGDLREISKDDMELPATITFWVFTGFAIIIALIVLLTWLGMDKDIHFADFQRNDRFSKTTYSLSKRKGTTEPLYKSLYATKRKRKT